MTSRRYDLSCVLITLALLGGAMANKLRLGSPPDAEPHLARVREAAQQVTGEVPNMIVRQGHVPRQAFELLRPNVLDARDYTDLASSVNFSVLLVHCGDIADMGAHYPPACYPGSGLKVTVNGLMPLELSGGVLHGIEYHLEPARDSDREPFCLWNCMFLPDGSSTYLPAELRRYARIGNVRYYGSGQIQVLVRASLDRAQRVAVYEQALSIYRRAIEAMLSDPRRESTLHGETNPTEERLTHE